MHVYISGVVVKLLVGMATHTITAMNIEHTTDYIIADNTKLNVP